MRPKQMVAVKLIRISLQALTARRKLTSAKVTLAEIMRPASTKSMILPVSVRQALPVDNVKPILTTVKAILVSTAASV